MQFVPMDLRMKVTLSGNSSPFVLLPNSTSLHFKFKFTLAIKLNFKQGRMIPYGSTKVERLFSSFHLHYKWTVF